MDYFLTLLFLIISCVIGIVLALFIGIKSYLWIAIICTLIFISIELYYNYKKLKEQRTNNEEQKIAVGDIISNMLFSNPNILASSLPTGLTITTDGQLLTTPSTTQPDYHIRKPENNNRFPIQTDNSIPAPQPILSTSTATTTLPALVNPTTATITTRPNNAENNNTNFEMDKPPFDGLPPAELLSRLNYIYYATANPAKMVNYHDYKTHADRYLDADGTKLSTNDLKLQTYSAGFYPQLTTDQIDARDCLNEGSGARSCFQSPQLFYNAKNNFNILEKGVNLDNANLIIKEDFSTLQNLASSSKNSREDFSTLQKLVSNSNREAFSMPQTINPELRYEPVLFMNAPHGNLDKPLDQTSNELIDVSADTVSLCHNCKLAVCHNDYCGLQNKLFM